MAPEIMKVRIKLVKKETPEKFDPFKADVYSFGLLLWCLMEGNDCPYSEFKDWDTFSTAIIGGHRPPINPKWFVSPSKFQ